MANRNSCNGDTESLVSGHYVVRKVVVVGGSLIKSTAHSILSQVAGIDGRELAPNEVSAVK